MLPVRHIALALSACKEFGGKRIQHSRFISQRLDRAKSSQTRQKTMPEFRSCVKVEVAVLGSPSLKVLMVSVDVR